MQYLIISRSVLRFFFLCDKKKKSSNFNHIQQVRQVCTGRAVESAAVPAPSSMIQRHAKFRFELNYARGFAFAWLAAVMQRD